MTTSGTSSFEPSRDTFFRRAMQLAGVLNAGHSPNGNDIAMMADSLGTILTQLQLDTEWNKQRATLSVTSGTATYTLPSSTLNVIVGNDRFVGRMVSADGSEWRTFAVSREEYQKITTTNANASAPFRVLIEDGASVSMTFWPTPTASLTFNYTRRRVIYDASDGTVTLDLPKVWQRPVLLLLAHEAALSKGADMSRVSYLRSLSQDAEKIARGFDKERVPTQFVVR